MKFVRQGVGHTQPLKIMVAPILWDTRLRARALALITAPIPAQKK